MSLVALFAPSVCRTTRLITFPKYGEQLGRWSSCSTLRRPNRLNRYMWDTEGEMIECNTAFTWHCCIINLNGVSVLLWF